MENNSFSKWKGVNRSMFTYFLNFNFCTVFLQAIEHTSADRIIIIVLLVLIVIIMFSLQKNRKINAELKRKTRLIQRQALEITDQNKRLEEKNKSLQALNDDKNNIIGVVSHDLKAPLNRIFALSNLMYLSGDNLTEEQKDYLDKMNMVVREGLDLIRNLLDIRAIEFKGIEIKHEETDLDSLLEQLVKTYKSTADQKNQTIVFINKIQDECHTIESDQLYINRIFDNLLSNAIKFSPPGKEIRIVLTRNSAMVTVRVEDQGPGISKKDQEKLFQKFQILSARPTAGETSTGLGLSITKSLVNLLEGKIRYEDNPEGGSVFVVELPVLTHA